MGLFSKFKNGMNGGVEVHVQAPSSVPSNQVIPVTVNVTSKSTQTVNSVKAEIKAVAKEQGLSMNNPGGGVGVQSGTTTAHTVAQAESRESFTINAGETKSIEMQLYINGGAAGANPMAKMSNVGGALGGVLQTVASVAQNFDHVNFIYSVHASVDVEGHEMNPSDKQSIQILPPTENNQTGQHVANLQSQAPANLAVTPTDVVEPQPASAEPPNPSDTPPPAN
jgi:hypothetical protein